MGAKTIYRITFPNGKIYVGMDLIGQINYFGSANSELIAADFTAEERRDFSIRKEILWESETASDEEVRAKEVELIRLYRSNDPAVGYNRWPRFVADPETIQIVREAASRWAVADGELKAAIREAHAAGCALRVIAAAAGVSHETVRRVVADSQA